MPRFVAVNPRERTVKAIEAASVIDAQHEIGLSGVDHGVAMPGLGYVVYQYGLFVPTHEQHYFGLGGRLFAGPTVFYAFDQKGATMNLRVSEFPEVRFYLGVNDVEAAIERDEIVRPIIAVNGVVRWEWPQPAPEGFGYGH